MVVGGGNGTQPLKHYFCFKCFSVYLVLTCTLMWSPPDKRDSRSCAHVDAVCVRAGITAEKAAWAGAAPEFAAQNVCFCLPVLKQVCVNCLPLHPAGNTCDPWICSVLQAQDSVKMCEKSFFNWLHPNFSFPDPLTFVPLHSDSYLPIKWAKWTFDLW